MTSAVQLDNISHRFGKVTALDGLSLSVNRGEMYGFLGRNGAGKTTTLKMLMGILRPDSGDIELLGERVTRVPVRLKQRIGYVCQEPNYYAWMTADQLGKFVGSFYPKWDGAEFLRLLNLLNVPRDRRASEMSGGTRTKLGLALALAPRPELLLLDEPTAGLDPVARREFNDQLLALQKQQGTTVMFSSHLVGEVEQLAQRVGIVQQGQTRFEGGVEELRASVRRIPVSPVEAGVVTEPSLAADVEQEGGLTFDAGRTSPTRLPGEGFECLRGDIWRATPARWDSVRWPQGGSPQRLSLEDIFLAYARTDSVLA